MAKIMLLANANPGLEIAKFIASLKEDEISALYVSGNYPEIDEKIINNSKVCKDRVFSAESIKDKNHLDWLKSENIDVLITVYWPYLLKKDFFRLAKKTVNFHPALLPVNRGWYPHVHSLIDGSASGVTLHAIDENADTGPIWVQREVNIVPTDTAKTIYLRLQKEIVSLFKESWNLIKDDTFNPIEQIESNAVYHAKNEINELDEIDTSKTQTIRETIDFLRARSFGDLGFSHYEENGEKVYINVRLSSDINMNKEKDEDG